MCRCAIPIYNYVHTLYKNNKMVFKNKEYFLVLIIIKLLSLICIIIQIRLNNYKIVKPNLNDDTVYLHVIKKIE